MNEKLKVSAIAFLLALAVSLLIFSMGIFSNLECAVTDSFYGGNAPLEGIVIVAIDDQSLQEIGRWPWDRSVFAEAMPVFEEAEAVGLDVAFFEEQDQESDDELARALKANGKIVVPVEFSELERTAGKTVAGKILEPIPQIAESAAKGFVNFNTDSDGVTRSINSKVAGGQYRSFSCEIYSLYLKRDCPGEAESGRMLVNFAGPPETFKTISFADVKSGKVGREEFAGKIVLVGATASDLHDSYFVPTSKGKAMSGVEIHANAVQTMINRSFVKEAPVELTLALMILLSLAVALSVYFLKLRYAGVVFVVLCAGYAFAAAAAFEGGLALNVVRVIVSAAITFVAMMAALHWNYKVMEERLSNAFGKYVPRHVISHVLKHPEIKLGGEKREMTVLFSDLEGFTTISERMEPEELFELMNSYLGEMSRVITRKRGIVDKYIGDAIVAYWGAPLRDRKHALRACRASIKMRKRLEQNNAEWKKRGWPELKCRIGISTGEMVVGNVGSEERMSYTVIGDAVNLGARLEGLVKKYQCAGAIASEKTRDACADKILFRKLDKVIVKGKTRPETIYEVVEKQLSAGEEEKAKIEAFERALEMYFKGKFAEAKKDFEKRGGDGPSKVFAKRCELLLKSRPPNWNGVWEMTEK